MSKKKKGNVKIKMKYVFIPVIVAQILLFQWAHSRMRINTEKSCCPVWTRRSISALRKKERKRVNSNIYKTLKTDRNYIDQNAENNISICLHLGPNFKMFTSFWGVKVPNVYYLFAICKEEKFYSFLRGKLCVRNILDACPVSVENNI